MLDKLVYDYYLIAKKDHDFEQCDPIYIGQMHHYEAIPKGSNLMQLQCNELSLVVIGYDLTKLLCNDEMKVLLILVLDRTVKIKHQVFPVVLQGHM